MPYNPKSQGAVESFNKTIQRFLESAVYHQKKDFWSWRLSKWVLVLLQ